MISRFYVGNVARNMTEARLRDFFVARGLRVTRVSLVMDRSTGHNRGFAFVEFEGTTETATDVDSLDGANIEGRFLRLWHREEQGPRRPGDH